MRYLSPLHLLPVLVAGLFLGASLPGSAQKKPKSESLVGFVDLGLVTEKVKESTEWKVLVSRYEEKKAKFTDEVDNLNKTRYLTKVEREELATLRAKKTVTEGENRRIQELEKKSDSIDREFSTLAGTEKLTDDQTKRLGSLDGMRKTALTSLQEEIGLRRQELAKLEGEVLDAMQKKILDKVTDVADSKEMIVVLDRQAVLYGGTDLTTDVLRKLGATVPGK